ncbi:HAMP domain-containing protein [Acidaminobacter sp. JC074]|uniref:cache domain-containing protein n=1 Tax=Acidaminobacter sp. JC074 TaxID=2530199 RepID=UPI001F0EF04B|nr:cache domain-containing protein [Acidaminobacter sp. JC074]MCH4889670.1 HAMP domain-containing protein [Acidaminobacter sp. JC074]
MKKIGRIFMLVSAIVMSLSLIIVGYLMHRSSTRAIEEEAVKYLELMAYDKGQHLENMIEEIEKSTKVYADMVKYQLNIDLVHHADNSDYMDHLLDFLKPSVLNMAEDLDHNLNFYLVFNIDLTDDIKAIVYSRDSNDENMPYVSLEGILSRQQMESESEELTWYYGPLNAKEGVWSNPYDDIFLKERLMTYSYPIIIEDQVIAIVGTDIVFESFQEIVEDVKVYDSGYAFLLDKDYRYLVHPKLDMLDQLSQIEAGKYAYMEDLFRQNDTGILRYDYEGSKKIMGYYHLSNGWMIAVAPVYEEVFETLNTQMTNSLMIIIAGLVISLLALSFTAYKLTDPIRNLTAHVEKIRRDGLNVEISQSLLDNPTEIGILSQEIDNLRNRLLSSFEDLKQHNSQLDLLVEERTAEIFGLNQELQASLESLQNMQEQLVESEKNTLVRTMVQNLAHKFSTPIGNSIVLLSYIKKLYVMDEKKTDKHLEAIDMLDSNLNLINRIINQMRLYLDTYDQLLISSFDISKVIKVAVSDYEITEPLNFEVHFDDSIKVDIYQSKRLVSELISRLLRYSNQIERTPDTDPIRLEIQVKKTMICLYYRDNALNLNGDVDKFFDPYYLHSFDSSELGLELNLVADLVKRGLKGNISVVEDKHGSAIKMTLTDLKK